jgi:hypothetical protein
VTEARWDTDFAEAHVIYHSANGDIERGLRYDWTLYMLLDGRIRFMERNEYGRHPFFRGEELANFKDKELAEACGRRPDGYEVNSEEKEGGNYVWSRKNPSPGLLPCYRGYEKLTLRIPGNEYSDDYDGDKVVRGCHETAVWFVGVLASYLESHTAKP